MNEAFADSFYFLALINVYDAHHEAATSLAQASRRPMITTEFVLLEVADALAAERWREGMATFVQSLRRAPTVEVIPLSSELLDAGLSLYAARRDKEWSLTDCISFQVMHERRMTDALTHDHHFKQAGFRVLL